MKVKKWKISLLFIVVVILAGAAWSAYTLTNAEAHYNASGADKVSANVINNDNVTIEEHNMYQEFSGSSSQYYIKANGTDLIVGPTASSGLDTSWPHAKVTCNDSNYQFSHFTATHCKHEQWYIQEKDDIEKDPLVITQTAWNKPNKEAYNVFYACFSDKVISKTEPAYNKFGTVSPDSAYFYMYKKASEYETSYRLDGDYPSFCLNPSSMVASYKVTAGPLFPDGSCTLYLVNPSYSDYSQGNASFKATPKSEKCEFVKWKYEPTGNGTAVANGVSGELYPGDSVTLTKEQLMTIVAVFDGEELPAPTVTPPTAIEGLYFNDTMQTLVNPGTTSLGKMMYGIGLDEKTVLDADWTETPPQACNAGDYYIWYKIDGSEEWKSVAPTFGCKVSISPVKPDPDPPVPDPDPPVPDPDPPAPDPEPDPSNPQVNNGSASSWIGDSSLASIFGSDAYRAPKTSDYLMFGVSMLALIFAVSVITAGIIKIRRKRKK